MVRVRKPQYAGETQLASFCKLFDIHIYPAHNDQLLSVQVQDLQSGYFSALSSIVKVKAWNYQQQTIWKYQS